MHDLESRLESYLDLTPPERQALGAAIQAHRPDLAGALEEAERLAQAFGIITRTAVTPDALAHLAARDHLEGHGHPETRPDHFLEDADLRHRFFALRDRVESLDRALPDPLAQFESLTGHRLEELEPRVVPLHPPASAAPARGAVPRQRMHVLRSRFIQYAVAASFALVALYGALAIASRASVSELDRLGALDPDVLALEGFGGAVRGGPEAAIGNDARYLDALETLRQARQSTLGLFPHYDATLLDQARRQLEGIVLSEERGSFLQLEASYVLGKTFLLMEQDEAARPHFTRVVEFGGRHADEAARVLASIEARRV